MGALVDTARAEGPDSRVVDVGAGTGILTGQLSRVGIDCVAVEPLLAMARQLRLSLPEVPVVFGAAERLPLADDCVQVYAAAQAFHWFEPDAALAEATRVLRPGGSVCLLWNVRDQSVPWVAELTDLVEERTGGRPYEDARDRPVEAVLDASGHFGPVEVLRYPNPVPAGVEAVLERLRSTSFVAAMDQVSREELIDAARCLLAGHGLDGDFEYPHETVLYRCQRVR